MAALPSYHEATARPDWLALAAPYVAWADLASLCLVCRRAWALFAPRLWADLLTAVRRCGLPSGDDATWWSAFVADRLARVAPATRALVRVLDASRFAHDAYPFASHQARAPLEHSFGRALELLPNALCLLVDGHGGLDPAVLLASLPSSPHRGLRLLSVADCPNHLPAALFRSPSLQCLVYLDISGLPGSVLPFLQPRLLPHLRVFKVRAREMDDPTLDVLAHNFARRLWSLDLSGNNVTDAALDVLRDCCIPPTPPCSRAHFGVEGRLVPLPHGTPGHGTFVSIDESRWSATFSHPERYFVDAPMYTPDGGPPEFPAFRSDGGSRVREDSAEAAARVLSQPETDPEAHDFCSSGGVTHLRLSNTRVSSLGIQKLLRISSGRLVDFACDCMPLLPRSSLGSSHWPASTNLYGILGAAHLFRPVFSSELRVLRIHHSLVTHVPTLDVDGLSMAACVYLAETLVAPRVDKAYPQAFVPDINPRLTCLTLTCIPSRSSGPLITKLINFIRLLSAQERAIQDAAAVAASPWRGPGLLQGLRHVGLEFEPDPVEDGSSEDLDAGEWINGDGQGFSFFDDEWTEKRQPAGAARGGAHSSTLTPDSHPSGADRDTQESVTYDGQWNGRPFSVPVWIGPRVPGSNQMLQEYRRLVVDHGLADGVGPASPSQVLAGAPDKSYVFHTAWCAAVVPRQPMEAPTRGVLAGMKDVLGELKAYRLATKASYYELQRRAVEAGRRVLLGAPHYFWTGTLQVSRAETLRPARPLQHWR